jgi:hypothetical protein
LECLINIFITYLLSSEGIFLQQIIGILNGNKLCSSPCRSFPIVRHKTKGKMYCSENEVINMLEFLIDNIFAEFGGTFCSKSSVSLEEQSVPPSSHIFSIIQCDTENDVTSMLESLSITYLSNSEGTFFNKSSPMGTNCAPLLADFFLCS